MRILLCGLAAFTLTLGFYFWHDGRAGNAAPVTRATPEPYKSSPLEPGATAPNPMMPTAAAVPAVTAITPPPVIAPREPAQIGPDATPDVDEAPARRDRDTERGARSH